MIKTSSVIKAISNKIHESLKQEFPDKEYTIYVNENTETLKRPAFRIKITNPIKSNNNAAIFETRLNINIYYFDEIINKNTFKVSDMLDLLNEIFDLKLKIDDRYLNILNTDSQILRTETNGNVLLFNFTLDFYDSYNKKESFKKMNKIHFESEVK